ncbi:MAG: hypothetical protein AB7N71_03065 [Phycisphaerae bacterium]
MNKRSFRRMYRILFATLGVGTALQVATEPTGCASFGLNFALGAVDFCSVLNCQGGSFFDFCDPIILFVDCLN